MSSAKLEVVKGKDIKRYLNEFAQLRMAFYQDYPYLHAADKESEAKYFQMFATNEDSRMVVAKEGNRVVGAIIGMPLKEMNEKYRAVYNKNGKAVDSIFYLGDILVSKEDRGEGIGNELYEKFESTVREMKKYNEIDLFRIDRPKADLKAPQDYQPTEIFWKHRGFHPETKLKTEFRWTDIGAKGETSHSMLVYQKKVA